MKFVAFCIWQFSLSKMHSNFIHVVAFTNGHFIAEEYFIVWSYLNLFFIYQLKDIELCIIWDNFDQSYYIRLCLGFCVNKCFYFSWINRSRIAALYGTNYDRFLRNWHFSKVARPLTFSSVVYESFQFHLILANTWYCQFLKIYLFLVSL